jgi:hypothetical protein
LSLRFSKRLLKIIAIAVIVVIIALARAQIMGISKRLLSNFPVLGWVEAGAELLVAMGCTSELILLFLKEPDEHDKELRRIRRNWERVWMAMVAVGVATSIPCLMISSRESAKLNDQASSNNVQVAILTATNLSLRSKVVVLETQNRDLESATFTLDVTNREASVARLKPFGGTTVIMAIPMQGLDSYPMFEGIQLLSDAGWKLSTSNTPPNLSVFGWEIGISAPTANSDPKQINRIRKAAIALTEELYNNGGAVYLETNQQAHPEDIWLIFGGTRDPRIERLRRRWWETNSDRPQ